MPPLHGEPATWSSLNSYVDKPNCVPRTPFRAADTRTAVGHPNSRVPVPKARPAAEGASGGAQDSGDGGGDCGLDALVEGAEAVAVRADLDDAAAPDRCGERLGQSRRRTY